MNLKDYIFEAAIAVGRFGKGLNINHLKSTPYFKDKTEDQITHTWGYVQEILEIGMYRLMDKHSELLK